MPINNMLASNLVTLSEKSREYGNPDDCKSV
jgi:hypothetical protein